MAKVSPNWAFSIYAKLWVEFKEEQFSRKQAEKTIKDDNLPHALSRLKKDGWMTIERDPDDSRKSVYKLKKPEDVIEEIGKT